MIKSKCQMKKMLMCICLVLCFFGCASSNKKQSKNSSEADKYQLAMGFNNLGANYVNKDMLDEAIVQFKRALTIKPDFAEARNNLGVAFCRQKMFDDAIAEFKLAVKINPDYSKSHDNLGFAYRNKNMFNEAIAEHNLALKINPKDMEAMRNMELAKEGKRIYEKTKAYQIANKGIAPEVLPDTTSMREVFSMRP